MDIFATNVEYGLKIFTNLRIAKDLEDPLSAPFGKQLKFPFACE